MRRFAADVSGGVRAFPCRELPDDFLFVHAVHQSSLRTEESVAERALQLGKVQNLRLAVRKLNGVTLPAGATFSFWKQVGRATMLRGYALGRELREGCLIPAIGGGLCQLSNALYAAALDAGAEIVERHVHSQVVPGSAAVHGNDATVAFNYIDLRFRFDHTVRIEAKLTSDELHVRFLGNYARQSEIPSKAGKLRISLLEPPPIGSCFTCGKDACFRHVDAEKTAEQTAFVLFNAVPEFADYVARTKRSGDAVYVPINGVNWRLGRYTWDTRGFKSVQAPNLVTLVEVARNRIRPAKLPALARARRLSFCDNLANALGNKLRPEQSHVVVAQDLLPGLWRSGHLGGRTFDVLMTRLPLGSLQEGLDELHTRRPESPTLGDFRVGDDAIAIEAAALAAATRIITPHPEIAKTFRISLAFAAVERDRSASNPKRCWGAIRDRFPRADSRP